MNKNDLIAAVAESTELPRTRASELVEAVFEHITKALRASGEVRLVGFGTFATATRKGGLGRNPRTGAEIRIADCTAVKFKPGKALKDAVQ